MADPQDAGHGVDISVVVCTRNRAGPLRTLLGSFKDLTPPESSSWELLIVDNGSTDDTPQVVADFEHELPIRYTREDKAGLANARNHGVAAARGRFICWTDDDVEIDRDWLAAYARAFVAHPEASVFGGRIYPKLLPPTPPWFARLLHLWPISDIVAARDFGDKPVALDFDSNLVPWGANYAVRRQDQLDHPYDPNLGVSPLHRRSGEETQAMFQIMSAGATGWWVPDSKVFHLYPPQRQSRSYFREHYFQIGETQAYLDGRYDRHYMNRDGRAPRQGDRPEGELRRIVALNRALATAFHAVGLTRRSLYHLRREAMAAGVLAYRASVAASASPVP